MSARRADETDEPTGDSATGGARDGGNAATTEGGLDDPEQAARAIALRKLAAQPRTRAELREVMSRRGIDEQIADRVLDRLDRVGLVDDGAFAEAWVETRHSGRGLARRALTHELRRRGVADDDIDQAVEQVTDDDERATARRLVDRKLAAQPGLRRMDRARQVRRLSGLLARKGYSAGVAAQVVKEALSELPTAGSEEDTLAELVTPLEDDDYDAEV